MHFGKQLKFLMFPPWKHEYIDYSLLKKTIQKVLDEGIKKGSTRTVTRKWITEKDGSTLEEFQSSRDSAAVVTNTSSFLREKGEKNGNNRKNLLNRSKSEELPPLEEEPAVDDEEGDSYEMVEVVDVYPHNEGEKEKDDDDAPVEIVVLTEELEQMFFTDFWKERDRVDAFFRENADAFKKRLSELVDLAEERRGHDIPLTPLKSEFFDLLMKCEELIDYASLNLVGFTKILKKFSHHTDFAKRAATMSQLRQAQFVAGVPEVEELCKQLKQQYVAVFSRQGKSGGENATKLLQELTHSVSAAQSWKMNTILLQMNEHMTRATINIKESSIRVIPIAISLIVYVLFTFIPILPEENAPAQRALAILLAAIVMWVTDCWPLFVTSVLSLVLCLVSYVFVGPNGETLSPPEAVPIIYQALFPSSLPLIIAGFCISTAWSKYGVDVMLSTKVLNLSFFRKPSTFIIAVMLICFFMSAWISNVAASLLTLTIITPIIRDLPSGSRYSKTLLLAIAIGGNAGGMTTQLASPQNAVTVSLGSSSISFIDFIVVSLPVYPLILIVGYFFIIKLFPPDIDTIPSIGSEAKAAAAAGSSSSGYASVALDAARSTFIRENSIVKASDRTLVLYQALTIALTILCVVLWIASSFTSVFGSDIGMISFLVIVLFCATGLVSKAEFERLPWALIILIAAGNVLGKAIESSKLLDLIAGIIGLLPPNLYLIVVVLAVITAIMANFVSSTIISIILLPLAAKIGAPLGHPRLMVIIGNHMCSSAMALPVSSMPNLTATSLEDSCGKPYLSTLDIIKIGTVLTLVSFVIVCSVSFGMSLLLNF